MSPPHAAVIKPSVFQKKAGQDTNAQRKEEKKQGKVSAAQQPTQEASVALTEEGRRINETYLPYSITKGGSVPFYNNMNVSELFASDLSLQGAHGGGPGGVGQFSSFAHDDYNLEELHVGIVMFKQRSNCLIRRLETEGQREAEEPNGQSVYLVEEVDIE